jgi:nucleoside phosphorylase/CheY-like chemotaxis protein
MAIKVLVVEDSPLKTAMIKRQLETLGVDGASIHYAETAVDARAILKLHGQQLDLIILDLAIPSRLPELPDGRHGLEFLQLVVDDKEYPFSGAIVGTTAETDTLNQYEQEFRSRLTQILLVSEGEDDWKQSLKFQVERLRTAKLAPRIHNIDVCFITALRVPELAAVLQLPIAWRPEYSLGNGVLVQEGTASINNKELKFICAHSTQMGLVAAAFMTQVLQDKFTPKLIIMTGICGGISDSKLGDVIIAEKSWDWQSGKWLKGGVFEHAPDQKQGDSELVAYGRGMKSEVKDFWTSYRDGKVPSNEPEVRHGPMVSGSAVVEDTKMHANFLAQHRKAIAVDMECYGVYFVTDMSGPPVAKVLCVKAVSDLASRNKTDDYQHYCSKLSAHVGFKIVERYFNGH